MVFELPLHHCPALCNLNMTTSIRVGILTLKLMELRDEAWGDMLTYDS